MKLSILIPTVVGRESKLASLLTCLDPQLGRPDVERILLRDNREMTIGAKRNRLIALARGQYIAFVDDDDMVAHDYVATILNAIDADVDVISFCVLVEGYGPPKLCHYGLGFQHQDLPHEYRRQPNHLMVWKRSLATAVPFQDLRYGEDTCWAAEITKVAQTERTLQRVLYTYQYDPRDNSTTARP